MQRNRQFDLVIDALLFIVLGMAIASHVVHAESLGGKFASGQVYRGSYSVADSSNADGMRVHPVTIELQIDGNKNPSQYAYVVDDIPSIEASDVGFLSIIVNSGGMEGSMTYNYIVPYAGKLTSIGTVQTSLHLGKVDKIAVERNKALDVAVINKLVTEIVSFNPSALTEASNAYPVAALLLLGQGKYLAADDIVRLSAIYKNKEISDDPIMLKALRGIAIDEARDGAIVQASNTKYVASGKAYFLNSPSPSDAGKSYLIKGDEVNLVRKSDDGKYWLVDYLSSSGRKTEKWLRCEDLDYCR